MRSIGDFLQWPPQDRTAVMIAFMLVSALIGNVGQAAAAGPSEIRLAPDPLALIAPSRGFDTLHTRLELDIDLEAQKITGKVTHKMRVLADPLRELALNCVDLTVDKVRIDGVVARFEHPVPGQHTSSWMDGVTVTKAADRLMIYPSTPLARGTEIEVEVSYHGAPRKGLYWRQPEEGLEGRRQEVWSQGEGEDNRYWIPIHDYPDDRASYEGIFRVPAGVYALSNGDLVERRDEGDQTVFHWRLDEGLPSYLIMLAAAEYKIVEDEVDGIALSYLVPPGTDDATIARGYGMTPDVMRFFNETIGVRYPYGKYAQVVVQDFIYGGMENTTATVMNMRSLYDEGTGLTRTSEGLVAHELAHQWWGDTVTCREWNHMWLNEGFASYYTALYQRHSQGQEYFDYDMVNRFGRVITSENKDARPLAVEFFNRRDKRNATNVYTKGASVLHMLRGLLGDDRYHAAIAHYLTTNMFGLVDTGDLARAVYKTTGENLDWFFEQWVFLTGHPRLEVSSRWDDSEGLLTVEIRQTQERDRLTPFFRIPTTIAFELPGGPTTRSVLIDQEQHEFHFALAERPLMVEVDPDGWVLMEVEHEKTTKELLYQINKGTTVSSIRGIRALATRGHDQDVVDTLARILVGDRFWGLRREAATTLGKIGTETAVDALVRGLNSDEARVRLTVAQTLGKVRASDAVTTALRERLRQDPAWEVRGKALTSLVAMRADGAAELCRESLEVDDPRGEVRRAALSGLADLKATKSLDRVERYTRRGDRRAHRHTAIAAYADLAKELKKKDKRRKAAQHLASLLDDPIARTRTTVIRALGTLGESSAAPDLRALASSDPLASVRALARKTADKLEAKKDKKKKDHKSSSDEVGDLKRRIEDLEHALSSVEKRLPH